MDAWRREAARGKTCNVSWPALTAGCQPCAPCQQEVSRYRLALRRMAGDLVSLHQRVTSLEVENGHLRHSLAGRQEPGRALLADGDVDVMTREEVLDRLGAWLRRADGGKILSLAQQRGPCCPLCAEDVTWALAATLKGELVSSTAEMRQLRDRVQRLQNELIRVLGWGRGGNEVEAQDL